MKDVRIKPGGRDRAESDKPTSSPNVPKLGDANMVEPVEQAEQATWQTYRGSTSHVEPPGHVNRRGVRDSNLTGRQRSSRPARRRHRESTDKDE